MSEADDTYLQATDLLAEGRPREALERLESLPDSDPWITLVRGKAHLELDEWERALECLRPLLAHDSPDPGWRAYVRLLAAAAAAASGKRDEALEWLGEAVRADERFEQAARSLKRRIEDGRPVQVIL